MLKHCYARVRAWVLEKFKPAPPPKERWVPGPRVQMHLRRTARKANR